MRRVDRSIKFMRIATNFFSCNKNVQLICTPSSKEEMKQQEFWILMTIKTAFTRPMSTPIRLENSEWKTK
jgi:hypothetical protein